MSDDTTSEQTEERSSDEIPDSSATQVMESPLHTGDEHAPDSAATMMMESPVEQAESGDLEGMATQMFDPPSEQAGEPDLDGMATQMVDPPSEETDEPVSDDMATMMMESPLKDVVAPPPLDAAPQDAVAEEEPRRAKRKIDLKARLSSVRAHGGLVPQPQVSPRPSQDPLAFPPPSDGSVPPPSVMSGGGSAFSPGSLSPFAPAEPEVKPSMQQQTIKVEVGEEIIAQRKKSSKKTKLYAVLTLALGLGVGFPLGGLRQSGAQQKKAVAGASSLAGEIEKANKVMVEISDALGKARERLGDSEYPEALADTLKAANVPFSSESFDGKGVGGLPKDVLRTLLSYTTGCEQLNKKKNSLRNLVGAAKKPTLKYFAQKKEPVVNFSVVFSQQGGNIVASLAPNKKPFKQKAKWPMQYAIIRPAGKKTKDVQADRYLRGKLFGTGDRAIAIPMAEKSVAGLTSQKLVFSLRKALGDTRAMVEGVDSPVPSLQTEGLLKEGKRLVDELKKIGRRGR